MKLTQRDFAGGAAKAARSARVFFFCGPDEAGASAAAGRIVALLDEPGERVEIGGAELRRDPVRLGDEARSSSLFGDARHILVRASGDEAAAAIELLLGGIDAGEGAACPVLVVATSATDKSRTAKLLEKRSDALVAMFWPPDLRDITAAVRQMADAAGLRMSGDLAERIARGAGLDVRLAQSEITKLALYADADPQGPRTVDAAMLEAIGAPTEAEGFAPLVDAVLSGRTGNLADELRRMRETGMNPVGLLLAFERRATQLAGVAAAAGPRGNVAAALEAETRARRVFSGERQAVGDQAGRWRGKRLERLVERLAQLHRTLLTNSQDAELLLAQGLTAIAREAARG